ncbi:hypothetical protein [Sphingobacterium sp. N143]|uniref:hypothetical protein n=1 Tax=Sphingobacterium sp. N143 TaxID=2746727 RepID=UPI002578EADE|nr:hypothetical protein [Sphingobacterium sp. N143]
MAYNNELANRVRERLAMKGGANLKKAFFPMTSNVVVDKNLITGQNPFSSKEMAKVVMNELEN